MQPHLALDAQLVEPVPLRRMQGIPSALRVRLDLPFQVVRPRPQAQTLVFVGQMLNSILTPTDVSVLQDMEEMQRVADALHVVQVPSKRLSAMISAPLVLLDL